MPPPPPPPPPPPLAASSPLTPKHAGGFIHFAPFFMYAELLLFADAMLFLMAIGYGYCTRWRRDRANQALSVDYVERLQQPVEAAALSVVVVAYRGDAREFNSDECAICLGSFAEGEECWVIGTCKHAYHESCIKKWLLRDPHCPLCRGSVRAGRGANVAQAPTVS